jgi:hypothetical protein
MSLNHILELHEITRAEGARYPLRRHLYDRLIPNKVDIMWELWDLAV